MGKKPLIRRYLEKIVFPKEPLRQMRFVAGPRQSGKTTLAKNQLFKFGCSKFYYNWDRKQIRDLYRNKTDFLAETIVEAGKKNNFWVCFDEIHKMPKWKNILKDFFDTYETRINFIITGSARLDMFRKSGDSLAGRYFLFKLNPLILAELSGKPIGHILPEKTAIEYIQKTLSGKPSSQNTLNQMLTQGGFPEPCLKDSPIFTKKWRETYFERIVKEDLRDLSAIQQLEKIIDLIALMPGRIGNPLSINSLKEDLELNFNTVKKYLEYLKLTYVLFTLPPYYKKTGRLVKKEKKAYFYDWSIVPEESACFENYVAVELKTRVDLWNDLTKDRWELFFLRNRLGQETDFLITRNSKPFMLCEAKLSSSIISAHHYSQSNIAGNVPFVQIVRKPQILKVLKNNFFVISAARFFG